jgi:hypothetical protein
MSFVTALAFVALVPAAQAAFPGSNGRLVFATIDQSALCSTACKFDIYTMNADGTDVRQLTATPERESNPTWSPDGQKIAFVRRFESGGGGGIVVMNADGSGAQTVLPPQGVTALGWSPSQNQLVYKAGGPGEIFKLDLATGTTTNLTNSTLDEDVPEWSPLGDKIAYMVIGSEQDLYTMNPDGSGQTNITPASGEGGYRPDWSPAGDRLAFGYNGWFLMTSRPDGSDRTNLAPGSIIQTAYSPDGAHIAYVEADPNVTRTNNGAFLKIYDLSTGQTRTVPLPPGLTYYNDGVVNSVDWQPIPNAYPRPKGATPMRASLVPAYQPCSSPNSTHGSPLAFPSCTPPVQASGRLTVGTPPQDPVNSVGYVTAKVISADVQFDVSITDVRNQGSLSDYGGELESRLPLRVTDKDGGVAATTQDFPFWFAVPCASTADTTVGSTCSVVTTADTLMPGAVTAGLRAIWALGQIGVYDGGSDGSASTTADNTLFMDQGIFVP